MSSLKKNRTVPSRNVITTVIRSNLSSKSRYYHKYPQEGHWRRNRPRRRLIPLLLITIWIILVIAGFLMGAAYAWFPIYYWAVPGVVALAISSFGAMRIWRYAKMARNVEGAWTRRIVMTVGLLITGLLTILLFIEAVFVDVYFLYPPYTSVNVIQTSGNQLATYAAANFATGLFMNLVAFVVPLFFAFMYGEAYLLYRLRHHYTISGF